MAFANRVTEQLTIIYVFIFMTTLIIISILKMVNWTMDADLLSVTQDVSESW